MIKKIRRGTLVKDIHLEEAFSASGDDFYVPVSIDPVVARSTEAKYLFMTFLPANIRGYSYDGVVTSLRRKPLFIKQGKNKMSLSSSDVEENSTNNSLFKAVYSSNIVSSMGSQDNFDNAIAIDNVYNVDTETARVVTRNSYVEINNITLIQENNNERNDNFIVTAFVLSENLEIIDYLSKDSNQSIKDFENLSNNVNEDVLQSVLYEVSQQFDFQFNRYVFPLTQRITEGNDIRGLKYVINATEDYFFQKAEEFDLFKRISIRILDRNTEKSFLIKHFRRSNFDITPGFSRSLLQNNQLLLFVDSVYSYYLGEELTSSDILDFELRFVAETHEGTEVFYSRPKMVSFGSIERLRQDILRYQIENEMTTGNIVNLSVEHFNQDNFFLTFNDAGEKIEVVNKNKYKMQLNLNPRGTLDFLYDSSFRLKFYDNEGLEINDITSFYYDDNLTEGNNIEIIDRINIKNIMLNNSSIELYFESDELVKSVNILFYYNNESTYYNIGPFLVTDYLGSDARVTRNIYDQASQEVGKFTTYNTLTSEDVINYCNGVSSNFDTFYIDTSLLIENINIKALNYFQIENTLETTDILSITRRFFDNVLVKINKKISTTGIEVLNLNHYCFLTDVVEEFETQENKIIARINTRNYESVTRNVDYSASLVNRIDVLRDFQNIISRRSNSNISSTFDIVVTNSMTFLLLKNKTSEYFGKGNELGLGSDTIKTAKRNLADFIMENNKSYSVSNLELLLDNLFNDTVYLSRKNELLRSLFVDANLTSYDISATKTLSFSDTQDIRIDENVEAQDVDGVETIQFSNVNFENYSSDSEFIIQSGLQASLTSGSFILSRAFGNTFDFNISGNNIQNLIDQKRAGNVTSATARMSFNLVFNKHTRFKNSITDDLTVHTIPGGRICVSIENSNFINLETTFSNNSISLKAPSTDFLFDMFENETYNILSSYLVNESVLIVENIIARVNVEFDYLGESKSLSRSIIVKHSETFNDFLLNNNLTSSFDKINLNLLDPNSSYFMPLLIYKKSSVINNDIQNRLSRNLNSRFLRGI